MFRFSFYISFILSLMIISCNPKQESEEAVGTGANYSHRPLNTFEITENKVLITGGTYIPLYGSDSQKVEVGNFYMDVYPVTNANYLAFVKANPQWQKSNVKKLFADANYLNHWKNDTTLGDDMLPNSPVTNISWFAANAYCKSIGSRLPTLDEWEYVAMADPNEIDARFKEKYNQYILDWYEKQSTYLNEIGNTYKSYWGVYDIHGLVWEWVFDFTSVLLTGESRGNSNSDSDLFCGSGSLGANDLMNYAAFMRYAFRGSLKANYNVRNLGFRTVKDQN
jgi:sulfatase modifying factor 1